MDLDAPEGFSEAPTVYVYSSKGEKWDIQGWYKMELISPDKGAITAKYRVDCVTQTPARASTLKRQ